MFDVLFGFLAGGLSLHDHKIQFLVLCFSYVVALGSNITAALRQPTSLAYSSVLWVCESNRCFVELCLAH